MAGRADVVVVGAGVMGLAAGRALRRAGRDPLVLEQFSLGHTRGSSHGATRIFRLAYEEPAWVRLAQEALPIWRELEAEAGETLLRFTGLVDISERPERLVETLESTGTAYELLTAEEVRHRFDLATTCCEVVLQPDAGVVLADRAVAAFRAGLEVREDTRVVAVTPATGGGARIETDNGAIEAEVAVVAAGAWARELLAGVGIDLPVTPTRETVAYFRLAGEREAPSVIDYPSRETYALTAGPGVLKVGVHRTGPVADPDEPGSADDDIVRHETEWAARSYRLAQPEPIAVETCLYTNTADSSFVLERHGPIVVCSACSGHGFKFAPAVGRRVAGLAARP
jgi:sarcosine oxidase